MLRERDFDLLEFRVSEDPAPPSEPLPIPDADVYLVEAHPRVAVTESVVERLASRKPAPPFIVLGEKFEPKSSFPLLRLRTRGVVAFADAALQLPNAIEAVAEGRFWLPRSLMSEFLEATVSSGGRLAAVRGPGAELTEREREVLEGLLENRYNKEIGSLLGITERGVKFHVSNLLRKHNVRRRADLILLFLTS